MGEWEFLKEAVKQVPALCVIAFLVIKFLSHLSDARKDENSNRNTDREIIAKIVIDATVERRDVAVRMQQISDAAHDAANETKEKFIAAINGMEKTMGELRATIASRIRE